MRPIRSSSSDGTSSSADSTSDVGDGQRGDAVGIVEVGVEPGFEQIDEHRGQLRKASERVLDVALAEREPDLIRVLGVAAQDVGLDRGESGEQDEAVEAVGLDVARQQALERGSHVGVAVIVDHDARRHAHPDVVDVALVTLDLEVVRTFLERRAARRVRASATVRRGRSDAPRR